MHHERIRAPTALTVRHSIRSAVLSSFAVRWRPRQREHIIIELARHTLPTLLCERGRKDQREAERWPNAMFQPEPATTTHRRISLTTENKSEIDFAQRFRGKGTELLEQPKNKTGQNVTAHPLMDGPSCTPGYRPSCGRVRPRTTQRPRTFRRCRCPRRSNNSLCDCGHRSPPQQQYRSDVGSSLVPRVDTRFHARGRTQGSAGRSSRNDPPSGQSDERSCPKRLHMAATHRHTAGRSDRDFFPATPPRQLARSRPARPNHKPQVTQANEIHGS